MELKHINNVSIIKAKSKFTILYYNKIRNVSRDFKKVDIANYIKLLYYYMIEIKPKERRKKMFNIEEQLKILPDKPGVYIMRDAENNIIYVGKAVNLKNRVRSYFRKTEKTDRIKRMVSLIDHFEYIVVDNEAEALILECNLIKKNRPRFNVLLKDDKTYPYIKIDIKSDYPNVVITRKIINDGSKYFGPYANPGAAEETLDFIKQK